MKSKIATVLLSILVAFGLWAYVVTNISIEETTTIHNVPVVFQNEGALTGRNLMLTGGMEQTVTLTLTGDRSEILKLSSNNLSVIVDLSRIYDAGRQSVSYTVSYPADVNTSSIDYQSDKPRIPLTVENQVTREFPVVLDLVNDLADNYRMDETTQQLSDATVFVTGPASVVDQMAQAKVTIDLNERSTSIDEDFDFVLCDREGTPVEVPNVDQVVTNVEYVHVNILVQRWREVRLDVDVVDGGGATRDTTTIEFDPPSILVAGSDEAIAELEAQLNEQDALILGTIDLSQLLEDTTVPFPVQLPAGITNLSECETVNVVVTFPDLMTTTLVIPNENITPVNVPAGMISKVWTEQLSVTVRGPRVLIATISAEDISVTVDFGDVQVGRQTNKAPVVTISAEYSGVGILNYGNVLITLEEPVPETSDPDDPSAQSATDPAGNGE